MSDRKIKDERYRATREGDAAIRQQDREGRGNGLNGEQVRGDHSER